jgi:hypothetical protein
MYFANPSQARIARYLQETNGSRELGLVLLGDAHRDSFSTWTHLSAQIDGPVVVGLFPGVIEGTCWHRSGAVVLSIPTRGAPHLLDLTETLPGPAQDSGPSERSGLDRGPGSAPVEAGEAGTSVLVLVDGLSPHVGTALSWLRDRCGPTCTCVGGGAGRLSMTPGPCLIVNDTLWQDAAVLVPLAGRVDLGVRHGWTRTGATVIATRTNGSVIEHLNWEPAARIYAQVLDEYRGETMDPDRFADTAAQYPFGLLREGREDVVRDPIGRTADGGIQCAGPVPENTILHVLKGSADALIGAARQVGTAGMPSEAAPETVFVADCVSRMSFLGDRMSEELQAVVAGSPPDAPTPYGILSIGEVASDGAGHLDWFNKTAVLASLASPS